MFCKQNSEKMDEMDFDCINLKKIFILFFCTIKKKKFISQWLDEGSAAREVFH